MHFEPATDALSTPVAWADTDGLILGLNPAFARWLGSLPGLALASVLFGLLHPITAAYVVLAALIGLYLGCLFDLTESLLVVVVAHALYDFVLLVWMVRRRA